MTAANAAETDGVVSKLLSRVTELATLPEITFRIIKIVEDPNSTARDLHKIITNDPSLCARILKIVNSAFYGLPGQIGNVDRAIVLLGLNAVKNIAIAASLTKLFKGGQIGGPYTARDIWVHSMATGAGCRLIAKEVAKNLAEEAFVAGLLHDLGLVVELQCCANQLSEVINQAINNGKTFREAELEVIGVDHQSLGRELAQRWKFPRPFVYVTGYHHDPSELHADNRLLVNIVYLANNLCSQMQLGFDLDTDGDEVQDEVLRQLGISAAKLDSFREQLPEQLEIVQQLLS